MCEQERNYLILSISPILPQLTTVRSRGNAAAVRVVPAAPADILFGLQVMEETTGVHTMKMCTAEGHHTSHTHTYHKPSHTAVEHKVSTGLPYSMSPFQRFQQRRLVAFCQQLCEHVLRDPTRPTYGLGRVFSEKLMSVMPNQEEHCVLCSAPAWRCECETGAAG